MERCTSVDGWHRQTCLSVDLYPRTNEFVRATRSCTPLLRWSLALCVCLSIWIGPARADQLVVQGESHARVRVSGLVAGMLQFEDAERVPREVWLGDVDLLVVESVRSLADFTEAERYLGEGDFERAIVRYQRALRVAEGFWADLVQARLLRACDGAERLDQALLSFVRVMRGETTGLAVAADMIPKRIPSSSDATVARGLKHLDSALAGANDEQRVLLDLVRYEVLRRTGDARATSLAASVAERRLPEILRNERTYEIQAAALRTLLQGVYTPGQLRALDQALADCPDAVLPSLLLLKGGNAPAQRLGAGGVHPSGLVFHAGSDSHARRSAGGRGIVWSSAGAGAPRPNSQGGTATARVPRTPPGKCRVTQARGAGVGASAGGCAVTHRQNSAMAQSEPRAPARGHGTLALHNAERLRIRS